MHVWGLWEWGCNQRLFTPPEKFIVTKTYEVRDYAVVKSEGYKIEKDR